MSVAIDLTPALVEALQSPAVVATLKRVVAEVNAEAAADCWMGAPQAARHLYGLEGCEERFRKLRSRNPELEKMSVGTGKRRRWRRSDLDNFMATHWSK